MVKITSNCQLEVQGLRLTWRGIIEGVQGRRPPDLLQTSLLLLFNDAVGMGCCNLKYGGEKKTSYKNKIVYEVIRKCQ